MSSLVATDLSVRSNSLQSPDVIQRLRQGSVAEFRFMFVRSGSIEKPDSRDLTPSMVVRVRLDIAIPDHVDVEAPLHVFVGDRSLGQVRQMTDLDCG